jgi:hypothetical protein
MRPPRQRFAERYGPWAVVAGASEGLGATFAIEAARRGLHVILVARRPGPLETLADDLRQRFAVNVETLALDLGDADAIDRIGVTVGDREVGLVVANAAHVPVGAFIEVAEDQLDTAVAVNARAPTLLARRFLPSMTARGRGGLVIVASMAGLQGGPSLVAYASTKAFDIVLAEGLWYEMAPYGVDVIGCVAGAVAGPKLGAAMGRAAPGTRTPEQVVTATFDALGRGPRVIPGSTNRVGAWFMTRLLSRRRAVAIMAKASGALRSPTPEN